MKASSAARNAQRNMPAPLDGDNLYAAEAILDKRIRGGRIEYLIKWAGWPPDANSWEPRKNISSVQLIEEYESLPREQEKRISQEKANENENAKSNSPQETKRSAVPTGSQSPALSVEENEYKKTYAMSGFLLTSQRHIDWKSPRLRAKKIKNDGKPDSPVDSSPRNSLCGDCSGSDTFERTPPIEKATPDSGLNLEEENSIVYEVVNLDEAHKYSETKGGQHFPTEIVRKEVTIESTNKETYQPEPIEIISLDEFESEALLSASSGEISLNASVDLSSSSYMSDKCTNSPKSTKGKRISEEFAAPLHPPPSSRKRTLQKLSDEEMVSVLRELLNRPSGFEYNWTPVEIRGVNVIDETVVFLLQFDNGHHTLVSKDVANEKCPQLVIQFYEKHVTWDSSK